MSPRAWTSLAWLVATAATVSYLAWALTGFRQ